MGRPKRVLSLSERWYDCVHIASFVVMFIVAYTIDIVSGISPVGQRLSNCSVVWGVSLENAHFWPPRFFYATVLDYCKRADEVFCMNPMWMKVMALWSPLFYGPFYVFSVYAFVRGRDWIRIPGLMWAWGMFYTVTVILFEEFGGDYPSPDFPLVFLANLWYCAQSMVVVLISLVFV